MAELTLTPLSATAIFVMACFAGMAYRRTWVREGPRWRLWLYGVAAATGLATVAFLPVVS